MDSQFSSSSSAFNDAPGAPMSSAPITPSATATPPASTPMAPLAPPIPQPNGFIANAQSGYAGGVAAPAPTPDEMARIPTLLKSVVSGGSWFWWIAGLSLVNVALSAFGGSIAFPLGLAVSVAGGLTRVLALALIALFGYLGVPARKGKSWAFLVGGGLYILDGLIWLLAKDFIGVALHGWALFSLFTGWQSATQLQKMNVQLPVSGQLSGQPPTSDLPTSDL